MTDSVAPLLTVAAQSELRETVEMIVLRPSKMGPEGQTRQLSIGHIFTTAR